MNVQFILTWQTHLKCNIVFWVESVKLGLHPIILEGPYLGLFNDHVSLVVLIVLFGTGHLKIKLQRSGQQFICNLKQN